MSLKRQKAGPLAGHADERRKHEQAIHRCQVEYKRLEDPLRAMYLDKLDGRIDNAFYDRMSAQWRTEQTRLLREIERHGSAEESYMEVGIRLLELARNASRLFAKPPAPEKNRILNLVPSNCRCDTAKVTPSLGNRLIDFLKRSWPVQQQVHSRQLFRQGVEFGWGTWTVIQLFSSA